MTERSDIGDPHFGERGVRRKAWRGALALVIAGALLLTASPAPTPSRGDVAAVDAAVAAPTTIASGGAFELTGRDSVKKPLRWLACRPIDFRINTAGMPKGMAAVVKESMSLVGKQTGARFRYAGTTKRTFSTTKQPSTPTIYFGFTPKRSAYGRTFSWPGEIGVGGPTGAWYQDGNGRLYEAVTSGRVLLSTTFRGPLRGKGATWQSLIVHEVGHALNLAHRSAGGDAMNPILSSRSPGRFQPAEVTALKRVLQRTGCDYKAWSRL